MGSFGSRFVPRSRLVGRPLLGAVLASAMLATALVGLVAVVDPTAAGAAPVAATDTGQGQMRVDDMAIVDPATTLGALGLAPLAVDTALAVDAAATGLTTITRTGVEPFYAIAVSWLGADTAPGDVRVQRDGAWTEPAALEVDGEDTPDPGAESRGSRTTTDLYTLGSAATGFAVSIPAAAANVQVHLVRSGDDAPVLTASASPQPTPGPPGVIPRSTWADRERRYSSGCADLAVLEGAACVSTIGVRNAVVHHTASENGYSADSVARMLRSIQAFHMDSEGWDDIGYNAIVDRFGRIWEARQGGLDRAVVGAHTGGFNTAAFGVAVLGSFESAPPPPAAIEAVSVVIAYELAPRNVDPFGSVTLVSNGNERFEPGVVVTVPTIAVHRDLSSTSCPGSAFYARLPDIRQRVSQLIGEFHVNGEFTTAVRTGTAWTFGGTVVDRAAVGPRSVRVDVDGATVATVSANPTFSVSVPLTASNEWACITDTTTGTLIGCRSLRRDTPGMGVLSVVELDAASLRVAGWAVDRDTTDPVPIHVYLDGALATTGLALLPSTAATNRTAIGGDHGFDITVPTGPGTHTVCVYAINDLAGGVNAAVGCRTATNATRPLGNIDATIGRPGGPVRLIGWALDPDTSSPIAVHVYVDGTLTPIVANAERPDIATAFNLGADHGFDVTVNVPAGTHTICAYAINNGPPDHTNIGCRTITDATPPTGSVDSINGLSSAVRISGWAIDPDTTDPISVHVYVDDTFAATLADQDRPDVAAALGRGAAHGFTVTVPTTPGDHRVCVYAINNNATGPHTGLVCSIVTAYAPNATPPTGVVEAVVGGPSSVRVAGWALDPDTAEPIPVHVYVNNALVGAGLAAGDRPDVAAAFAVAPTRGFDLTVRATPGSHTVCAYAINNLAGASNTLLGCRVALVTS
jgi:hypothetical protein